MPNLGRIKCSTGNLFLCISCSTEPCSGGCHLLMGSVIVLSKISLNPLKKSSLKLSHVFSTRTAVCFWTAEQHSQLAAINFFPNPASLLQIQSRDLATCSSYKWGTMGFCDGNDDPSWPTAMSILCCWKGSWTRLSCATCHLPLLQYWSIIDHPTCPKLVLTGRAKGEWMEELGFFNGCLPVLLYVFHTVWLKPE